MDSIFLNNETFTFEVCANSVESCIAAQQAGAHRVELCASIPEGGTTPSLGEITIARQRLHDTRLHVIIRPRGGDFLYSDLELERMIFDIETCRKEGVDGVVFGCLTAEGEIDMEKNKMLMACARGMSVTFHRAFDRCLFPLKALEQLASLGFDRILTSGQQPTAIQGVALLAQLHQAAHGKIHIMAGCGVNEHNIRSIYEATGIHEYHFSARERIASRMRFQSTDVRMGNADVDESTILQTTPTRVRQVIASLHQ